MTPTEWFDQFPPNPAMDDHNEWCARHWAPCPVLHANGIAVVLELQRIFLEELLDPNLPTDAGSLNAQRAAIGKICCRLGDERMYEIWGRWGPGQ